MNPLTDEELLSLIHDLECDRVEPQAGMERRCA